MVGYDGKKKKKKSKIKHQDILEPTNNPPQQIADVVWLEKDIPRVEYKKPKNVIDDAIGKAIKDKINK